MIGRLRPTVALRSFARSRDGSYAVEFAIISSLLVVLVIGLVQFAMIFLARNSLEASLQTASRSVLTGSFQTDNADAKDAATILANLRSSMCGSGAKASVLSLSCANMKVDVSVVSAFAGAQSGSALDASGGWAKNFGTSYACPGPRSIAVIRAALKYPLFVRALSFGLSSFSDGAALIQSSVVFRVEQYQSGASC
ncbi:TadE/TadG family type IV pilus assembly protein [Chenggangzhangella methanolivorans]|uniref:Pilus assembly protein n=1 Tax=Chenggangzhangella methanolivorans TaxID=1437009 RepID=A0A9E6RAJ3_9HYPH|nr:TadE/TadG family type IV pilus assembly protein [Chenggangzhangella methanolivorans]QZN99667.1 pilus assembly protein [Chenggangzhangella methanolivorans]